jgi:mercuric ion transport protein
MNGTKVRTDAQQAPEETASREPCWFAAGGVIGAVSASAGCIGPLALLTLGVSGAWIGNLTALEPYKPYFSMVALVFIGLGFLQVYFLPKPHCGEGYLCMWRQSSRVTEAVLWSAAVLVTLALTINWWTPLFY